MANTGTEPRRHQAWTLWVLAIGVVFADAAVWFVGISYGLIGMVIAVAVIIWTQRKADGYWRARNAASSDSVA